MVWYKEPTNSTTEIFVFQQSLHWTRRFCENPPMDLINGACAHQVLLSKIKWKPFWLATHASFLQTGLVGNFVWTMTYSHRLHSCVPRGPYGLCFVSWFFQMNVHITGLSITLQLGSTFSSTRQLGHGQFGEVYMAVASGIVPGEAQTRVAVKVGVFLFFFFLIS